MGRHKKDPVSEAIKEEIEEEIQKEDVIEGFDENKLIPTGIPLFDLACTGTTYGGLSMGKINTFFGSESSGKSFLCAHINAAIANNARFNEYDIIYDDCEHAYEFNTVNLFGQKLADRMSPPKKAKKDGIPIYSKTIQEFKNNILSKIDAGKSFIWTLDSLDSLSTDEELEKEYKEAIKAAKSDEHVKEIKGSYNTEKARILGQILRMVAGSIKKTNSCVNIIQQTRQNLNAGLFGQKEITSGGNSPRFYSTIRGKTVKIKTLTDSKYGLDIGQKTQLKIIKNKLTGNKRDIEFDIYNTYGVDVIGSCIDFMISYGFWPKVTQQTINAVHFGIEGTTKKIREFIFEKKVYSELVQYLGESWKQIEDSLIITWPKVFEQG